MTLQILLVDDNRTFLAAVKNFLDTLPQVEVVGQAYNGRSALALAEQLQPDLVLLDIVMPEMNGLDTAAALQKMASPPRIVFLSMHDSAAYRTAARELGARGYIGKGDFVADLVPLIDSISSELATPAPMRASSTGVQP